MILIVDDHRAVADGIADALSAAGHSSVVCYDAESAEVVVENAAISAIVCDIRLTGSFRFEGLDLLQHARRHAPGVRVALISGSITPEIRAESVRCGADLVLLKPFAIADLEPLLLSMRNGSDIHRVPVLEDILEAHAMASRFQPVFRLEDKARAGIESLATLTIDSFLGRPDLLFEYAARKCLITELELECIANAFEASSVLGESLLFVNIHPAVFSTGDRLCGAVFRAAEEHGLSLDRVVLEITEQAAVRWDDGGVAMTFETLRSRGIRFAFDDVGMAYSHLPLIERIRPAYLKISQHFGTGFESDPTRLKLVRNIRSLAADFGAELILEGIETAATLDAARAEGIELGQGYHLAHPMSLDQIVGERG